MQTGDAGASAPAAPAMAIEATFTWEFGGYESEWQGTLAELAEIINHGRVEEGERLTSILIVPYVAPEQSEQQKAMLALLDEIDDMVRNVTASTGSSGTVYMNAMLSATRDLRVHVGRVR